MILSENSVLQNEQMNQSIKINKKEKWKYEHDCLFQGEFPLNSYIKCVIVTLVFCGCEMSLYALFAIIIIQ